MNDPPPNASSMLRYGASPAHLDVDFTATGPQIVTALLAGCLGESAETIWSWTLTARLRALVSIARATFGDRITTKRRCTVDLCREWFTVEIDLGRLALAELEEPLVCATGEASLVLRLPCGMDQLHWQKLEARDERELARLMATSLVEAIDGASPAAGWQLPTAWLDAVDVVLTEHDPLTALQIALHCPQCGDERDVDLDVEATLVELIARARDRLLGEIDCLARAYHWSEAEILAIPPRRRRLYLARVGAEAS